MSLLKGLLPGIISAFTKENWQRTDTKTSIAFVFGVSLSEIPLPPEHQAIAQGFALILAGGFFLYQKQ